MLCWEGGSEGDVWRGRGVRGAVWEGGEREVLCWEGGSEGDVWRGRGVRGAVWEEGEREVLCGNQGYIEPLYSTWLSDSLDQRSLAGVPQSEVARSK